MLTVTLPGAAQGKGSKRAVVRHGQVRLIDDNAAVLRSWTGELTALMYACRPSDAWDAACGVAITVYVRRPRAHWGTGRNARRLKPGAPARPGSGRDLDKVARAVLDCISGAGWWADDARAALLLVRRCYDDGRGERVEVSAWEMGECAEGVLEDRGGAGCCPDKGEKC